ncbi:PREDICTED: ankyrin-3-like [Amphimedon queenslandica]|nr:PREDICTED: ankyrin-3-like [Amphimedon queenslandica]|eukprot:XP_019861751.1 PREDICTED: ankyrin-3-like [Amphimedon queenslandica]
MLNYIISQYNLDANLPDPAGQTPLMYSCSSGSINAVDYLITCHNSDPNITDLNGMTNLHHSCRNGHIDVTQYLIEVQHCDVNKTDNKGRTLVHHAASSGNFNLVQYLITEQGLSPTAVDKNGLTALHYASRTLNLHLVQELVVTHHLDPQRAAKDGRLPIHDAAQSGAIFILDYFVKSCKCNLNQKDTKGCSVFHYSSTNGNSHFVKHVISQYPKCNKLLHATDDMGNLPLHVACQSGNARLVTFLIDDMKCDVTATNKRGKSCVSLACSSNNLNLVQLLVQQYKLNPFAADKYGFTPLHVAAESDSIDILEWYSQQYGVDIANHSSRDKYTLAHLAAYIGALKFLKHLIDKYQCDVNATTTNGSTSLHLACEGGHLPVVLYLTSLPQCNVAATTLDGSTVLHKTCICIFKESFPMLKHLVENHQLDLCAVNDNGMAPIHIVCSNGKLDSVQYIIEHSPSLLELPESVHGYTPFLISVSYDQLKVIQYLISKNCNLSTSSDAGFKSAHLSANYGCLTVLKYLVDNNYCDLNGTDHQERTPLHIAILADQFEIIEYILNKSIPLVTVDWLREVKYSLDSPQDLHTTNLHFNVQDHDGNTPLHLACEKGKKDIVSLLVKSFHSSSYFLIANKKGETPLHLIAAVGSNDAAEALLVSVTGSLRSELFATCDNEGCTVFHTACSNGHLDVFRFFCNVYPDGVHVMDDKHRSLLYAACKSRNTEIVKGLIEKYKLDPESKDIDGTSCLHLLAGRGHVEMYRYLKQYIHSTAIPYNKIGRTPLHYACSSGRMNMAIYLIETYSCSPDDPDYNGYTAVHAACESGSIELVRYFLTNLRCNAYTETKELQTLLYFASKSSNLELVRYLVNVFRLKPRPHDIEVAQLMNPDSSVVKYLQKVHTDMILDMVEEERRKAKEGGYHEKLVELPEEQGTKYQQ